jgi:hypothetical protein
VVNFLSGPFYLKYPLEKRWVTDNQFERSGEKEQPRWKSEPLFSSP